MRLPSSTTALLALLATSSSATSTAGRRSDEDADTPSCGLYLAVSSTSTVEEPKWGIYAGKEYPRGVPIGSGDVAIQTFNLMANALPPENDDEEDDEDAHHDFSTEVEFFEQFIWGAQASGGQFELEEEEGTTLTAVPGVGVVGAYNPKLTNSDWNHTAGFFRDGLGDSSISHPGRGAYSTFFFNVAMRSIKHIPAGMEIFINHGDDWDDEDDDEDEEEEEEESDLFTRDDYDKIDETVEKLLEFFQKHQEDFPDDAKKAEIYNFLVRDVVAAAAGEKKGAKITTMLPSTAEELAEVKSAGGAQSFSQLTAARTLEWLSTHGRCMDHIRSGPSTIPHAGRGAFANRKIPKDNLVSPVPLIQIVDEGIMNMYEIDTISHGDGEYLVRKNNEVTGSQLLINYCFGHPESTMMFFPSGAVSALINHASGDKANAKLTWSNHPNHHKHWYDLTPDQLIEEENQHIGLLMEIVATRDIEEGEEVFIDYGPDWQAAWDNHVKSWESKVKSGDLPSKWPLQALDLMMAQKESGKPMDQAALPDNVMLKCFLVVTKPPKDESPSNDARENIRLWSEPDDTYGRQDVFDADNLFDCKIMDHQESTAEDGKKTYSYTVAWEQDDARTIVKRVPHAALVLVDKPGTSDQFLKDAFRHYIAIPDDVFPQGPWRNVE